MKKAALYIRVSTDEQARHGLSLDEQRATLVSYANSHGYTIIGMYADEGASARKTLNRRLQFQQMMQDVRDGRIDIILFIKLDRWFRNVHDYYIVQDVLDQHGVVWECTNEDYNTTTTNGRLMLNLKLSIAQNESDQTSDRIKFVFEGKRRRHEVLTGTMPPGYIIKDKHAIIDERIAPLIRKVFYHVYGGGSIHSALQYTDEAHELGIHLTYRKIRLWLVNSRYTGEMHGMPGYCPAIIPPDVFARVQDIINNKGRSPRTERIYLFSGLIRCPHCGGVLGSHSGRKNTAGEYHCYEYRCSQHFNQSLHSCSFSRSVFERKLENYLLDNMHRLITEHIHVIERERIKRQKQRSALTAEAIATRMERLKDLYLDELITKDMYKKDYKKLKEQQSALDVPLRLPTIPKNLQKLAHSTDFRQTYESLTRENKKRFWCSIIQSITFDDKPETRGKGAYIPFRVKFL